MAKRTSTKNGTTLKGTSAADTLTVKHEQITVTAGKGKDTINVTKGSKHYIYGEAGADKITIGKSAGSGMRIFGGNKKFTLADKDRFIINGGKKNYFYGGKGADTFTINAGTTNYLYGKAGNDVFAIGKNSTGKAIVKDFSVKKGNKDSVQVIGRAVKDITISKNKKDMIITGGKSGKASLTLEKAKGKTFTVTDSRGSYKVKSANIALTLDKYFKGTLNAPSFITTIDARKLEREKNSYGWEVDRDVNVSGNAKANTIYVANINGGTWQGGAGKDTIVVTKGDNHIIYGDDKAGKLSGNDTITVINGTGHNIYGGAGSDTITVEKSFPSDGSSLMIDGGSGIDYIHMYGGGTQYKRTNIINGGADDDRIYLYDSVKNYITVNGGNGNDTIEINGGNEHIINGDAGDDTFTIKGGSGLTINGDSGVNTMKIYSGKNSINGGIHKDKIYLYKGVAEDNNINAGNGNDEIYVEDGKHFIHAGDGNDTITIAGGIGETWDRYTIWGDAGEDTINITGGEQFKVNGGVGKDMINITAGSNHVVENNGGDDRIYIKSGAGDNIAVYGNDESAEYVEINSGNKHTVSLGNGENKVLVTKGKEHNITTGVHKDIITVQNKTHVSNIVTGEGNDEVTIKDGAFINNFENWDSKISLRTGGGDDTIIVEANAGDNSYINTEDGKDTIKIKGGNKHVIYTGNGDDIIEITGGEEHTIHLGQDKNTLTISAKGSTISTTSSANDNITINWNKGKDNGKYTINSQYDSILYGDTLTIKGASRNDFDYSFEEYYDSGTQKRLLLSSKSGDGYIVINDWWSNSSKTAAFSKNGITFTNDGTNNPFKYNDINSTYMS